MGLGVHERFCTRSHACLAGQSGWGPPPAHSRGALFLSCGLRLSNQLCSERDISGMPLFWAPKTKFIPQRTTCLYQS